MASEIMVEALCGDPRRLETFEGFRHHRVPAGNLAMALGMGWYRLRERIAGNG